MPQRIINRPLSTEAAKCRWSRWGAPAVTGGRPGVLQCGTVRDRAGHKWDGQLSVPGTVRRRAPSHSVRRSAPGSRDACSGRWLHLQLGARPAVLTANSRRRLLSDHDRSRELTETAVVAGTRRGRITVCPLLVSAAARHGRQVCANVDGSRALPSWHAAAGGRPTRARSARPRWPPLREADRALQLLLPARLPAPRLPARCRPRRLRDGSAGRDSGCGKGGPARPAAIGTSTYAYSGARQSAAQHSRSQRFLAAPFSCNGSLAVSRAQLSLSPRPSFLVSPLSLPSPCLSVLSPSLSFCLSLARILLLFAQFQRLSVSLLPSAVCQQRNGWQAS